MMGMNTQPGDALLEIRDLRTHFFTDDGVVKAVDGVSFSVPRGKTFALVGESGCGKSVTAFSILRLLPMPPARIVSGSIHLDGRDLLGLSPGQMRQVRGGQVGMIFQEPMSSLNPVFTCGSQIAEAVMLHARTSAREARRRAIDLLAKVGIPEPAQRFGEYPHQLSGGMRQRVMIAMALSCSPRLLIADEPTTALDVTTQAQILDLLGDLQERENLGILLITHDLAVVAQTAHVVGVMYASKIVELTSAADLFSRALHPYTQGLFRSLPRLGVRGRRLETLGGSVPNPLNFPTGCKFHPRCATARMVARTMNESDTVVVTTETGPVRVPARCASQEPPLRQEQPGHSVACWHARAADQADAPPAEEEQQ
jgi:oligopeptide/dipeptide ABC transporter ATP-binding protein